MFKNPLKAPLFFFVIALFYLYPSLSYAWLNSVTFINSSGKNALVKLINSSNSDVKITTVPDGSSETVSNLSSGIYYIKIRYGEKGGYYFSKGDQFSIDAAYPYYEEISITLHKVVNGNYETDTISESEFNK